MAIPVQEQVKTLVTLFIQRPTNEVIAQQIDTYDGCEHLDIVIGDTVQDDELLPEFSLEVAQMFKEQ